MIFAFIAVAVVIVVAAVVLEGQRRQALGRVAGSLGFSFTGGQHALPEITGPGRVLSLHPGSAASP